MNIRFYKKQDFELLSSWWKQQNEPGPTLDMLPEDSTFIVEINNKPIISVCLYLTNCKEVCYIENLIANPEFKENRKEYIQVLFSFLQNFAKNLGYKKLMCMAYRDALKKRYQEIGLTKTLDVSIFIKEL